MLTGVGKPTRWALAAICLTLGGFAYPSAAPAATYSEVANGYFPMNAGGALWFTGTDGNGPAVGRLDPATGQVTFTATPPDDFGDPAAATDGTDVYDFSGSCPASPSSTPSGRWAIVASGRPEATVCGPIPPDEFAVAGSRAGGIWIGGDGLSRLTRGGVIETRSTLAYRVFALTEAPDGSVWWSAQGYGSLIGRSLPDGTVRIYDVGSHEQTHGLAVGLDGAIWFAQTDRDPPAPARSFIGRLDPATGATQEFSAPAPTTAHCWLGEVWSLATAADGNVWFTDPGCEKVGVIDGAGHVSECLVYHRTADGTTGQDQPYRLARGPDGAMYFDDLMGDATTEPGQVSQPNPLWRISSAPGGCLQPPYVLSPFRARRHLARDLRWMLGAIRADHRVPRTVYRYRIDVDPQDLAKVGGGRLTVVWRTHARGRPQVRGRVVASGSARIRPTDKTLHVVARITRYGRRWLAARHPKIAFSAALRTAGGTVIRAALLTRV